MSIAPVAPNNYVCDFINVTKFRDVAKPFIEYRNFNVGHAVEASVLVAAETHEDPHCIDVINQLLNFCADRGPVVFVTENLESGEILDRDTIDEYFRVRGYRLENPQNIHVIGWDIDRHLKSSIGEPPYLRVKFQRDLDLHLKHKEKLAIALKGLIFIEPGKMIDLDQIARIAEEVNATNAYISYCEEELRKIEANPYSQKRGDELFPLRTEAAASTLQRLPEFMERLGLPQDTLVLMNMGLDHAKQAKEEKGNPDYDLTPFYRELGNHRASILIPKRIAHL